MKKAYGSVNWIALVKVMKQFGICERLIDMVWRPLNNCWYSILINGQNYEHFTSNKGLRWGHLLSPYLYIILNEVFSIGLNELHAQHKDFQYYTGRGAIGVSHLAYVDDILLFCNRSS